jgi:hypothetical protein
VLAEAKRRPGTSIRSVATALRSLFAFLHIKAGAGRSTALAERSLRSNSPAAAGSRTVAQAGPPPLIADQNRMFTPPEGGDPTIRQDTTRRRETCLRSS